MKITVNLNTETMETILKDSRYDMLSIARELGIDEINANNYDRVWYKLKKKQEARDASPKGEIVYKNDGEKYTLDVNIEDKYLVKIIELGFTIAKRVLPLANMIKAACAFAQNIGSLIKNDIKEFEGEFTVPESVKKYAVLSERIGDRTVAIVFVDDGYTKKFYSDAVRGDPIDPAVVEFHLENLGGQKFIDHGLNFNLTKRDADRKVRQILRESEN